MRVTASLPSDLLLTPTLTETEQQTQPSFHAQMSRHWTAYQKMF